MGRYFWIMIGILGLLLIVLIASGDTGTTLGFETNTFATAAVSGLWAVLIGSAVFGGGTSISEAIKHMVMWAIIILALMAAYVFRFDLQDIGSRFTGGLIPGSPIAVTSSDGRNEVTLIRSNNGHFEAAVDVNNAEIRFLVDTGATAIVLSADDASAAGIDPARLDYTILTQTANGTGRSAIARIDRLNLGGIERQNLRVMVAQPGKLTQSLLGQQFLESLSSYEKRGDRLTLRD